MYSFWGSRYREEGMADIEDFQRLDIRVGRVTSVDRFPEGRYSPMYFLSTSGPS